MPSSDYTASSGALRLKGGAGVSKPKKKKPKKPPAAEPSAASLAKPDAPADEPAATWTDVAKTSEKAAEPPAGERKPSEKKAAVVAKTAAELRYEESRKRRLEERLRREGARTHKERVEELNKYLSGLSEHHDMCVFPSAVCVWVMLTLVQAAYWTGIRLRWWDGLDVLWDCVKAGLVAS
jgi:protein FAM32A